ncbi:stage VI sporulation protein D [Halalkalibacter sp. APA_J-10(15)]|uniref:stage VI sporulation protein D n=1 Tax=Halalkalibacter sp. APA_J-10(15) TaxID=2933805 RepID=UPI001FF62AD3|nr:stage VI sporulation protein D [Halalkalibacter sp. APA_J-10(15)]MCK0473546.1 stage VI sporulation protein D [Halalkalibacter sp. APA_J-10(15)]
MSLEHPSKLSFSIEESVWLNKGEEVEEVIGMSLEPEIMIEERDAHVYIRGGLRLLGEYRSSEKEQVDLEQGSLEEQVSFRSVGDVRVSSNGVGEIKHYFPIDVTIPSNRIQNLDDVYVQVESFDYDLPEPSCIQLTADIAISGMTYKQDDAVDRVKEDEQKKEEATTTAFSFEAKKEQSIEKEMEVRQQVAEQAYQEEGNELQEEEETSSESNSSVVGESENDLKLASEAEVEEVDRSNDELEEPVEEWQEVEQEKEMNIHISPLKELAKPKTVDQPTSSNEQELDHGHVEEVDEKKPREENALYLTKMLSKGEERFSKWKMCIIQENESLEMIAQRYDISMSQLIRMNRLQGEQVEEGQILYIPISVES